MTKMKTYKPGVIADAGVLIILGFLIGFVFDFKHQPANAVQAAKFDHSQCQYPDRTTNPPNGCDNIDPCDPANVKGGSGECTEPSQRGGK